MPARRSMQERDALGELARIHVEARDLLARLDQAGHLVAAAFMSSAVDAIEKAVSHQRQESREIVLADVT